tara:strand:+ start:197 stop:796 length:600 start_codon:yes stop_codon:yes gene_type:complete
MKKNTVFQLLIFSIIFLSIFLFYYNFFYKKNYQKQIKTEIINEVTPDNFKEDTETNKSVILNLEYKSSDAFGNEYILKANSAEILPDDEENLKLIDVRAVIYLKDKTPINISSDFAFHNKNSFDTNFFSKVEIKHDEFDIESENLDLLYASNLVSLYNVKQFVYRESSLKVDKINFDILTKDLSMNMFKNNERINILYK